MQQRLCEQRLARKLVSKQGTALAISHNMQRSQHPKKCFKLFT